MTGALDTPFHRGEPPRDAFALAYLRVTFEIVDDAGHYSMLETPVRVASIIEKQLVGDGCHAAE